MISNGKVGHGLLDRERIEGGLLEGDDGTGFQRLHPLRDVRLESWQIVGNLTCKT